MGSSKRVSPSPGLHDGEAAGTACANSPFQPTIWSNEKNSSCFRVFLGDQTYSPVIWGLFHKPWIIRIPIETTILWLNLNPFKDIFLEVLTVVLCKNSSGLGLDVESNETTGYFIGSHRIITLLYQLNSSLAGKWGPRIEYTCISWWKWGYSSYGRYVSAPEGNPYFK